MKNRIDQTFQELRRKKQKAFLAFVTAGFPNLFSTEKLVLALEQAGVDILELGVPFSDPLADGPTIQAASQMALERGTTVAKIFQLVSRIRKRSQIPIALMTYYNPVFHYGEEQFVRSAKKAGVDGLIIPDLPPEEAKVLIRSARDNNLALVFFLSPTTTPQRMKHVVKVATGFIYFVSLTGVTGERQVLPADLVSQVRAAKRLTKKPVCVGFGISTPQQVARIAEFADGVIVGSAIIKEIQRSLRKRDSVRQVRNFVQAMTKVLKP
jgi:tryptophan synthase alpha chain